MTMSVLRTLACAGSAVVCLAASANAEIIYGITGASAGGSLVRFDSATPGTITSVGAISGIAAGLSVRGIDFRPVDGKLYTLATGASGAYGIYTLNLTSGAATLVGSGTATGVAWPTRVSMDFNPVADRIRVVTSNATANNMRFNPNNGAFVQLDTNLAYAPGDPNNAANPPFAVGVAYTNNVIGPSTTTAYVFDFNNDVTSTLGGVGGTPSPNGGQLFTVGPAVPGGFLSGTGGTGFDISGASGVAYLSYDDLNTGTINTLGTVNLATGGVSPVGNFGSGFDILDISVQPIPAPAAAGLLGLGGLLAARRRRA